MRPTTSCAMTVKNILFPPSINIAAMKYGRDMEDMAKQDLSAKLKKDIKLCRLFIDCDNLYLSASPDGLLDEDVLVEIKCPLSAENLTAEEAIRTLPHLKNIFDTKDPNVMNRNHRFFYQVQGQLNITQRDFCIFAVWTPKSVKTVLVKKDKDFWQNKMLPFLKRFYFDCMLPEILDSQRNRHMPIREAQYIIEAKEKLSTSVIDHNTKRQHTIASINEEENETIDNKPLKYNNISIKNSAYTEPTVSTAVKEQEDEDCIIVNHVTNYIPTVVEMESRRRVLDGREISLSSVKENVLPINSTLDDESLDLFLRVMTETSCFETQSIQYINYPDLIKASCRKSVQIIGGRCTNHWRCIFYDGMKLYVYDSIRGCTYDKMSSKEKKYISARFPQIVPTDINFEKVQTQPDGTSCGIYAAAFATDIVLGRNPCKETYSNDVESMRRHFVTIVENHELLPFPRQ